MNRASSSTAAARAFSWALAFGSTFATVAGVAGTARAEEPERARKALEVEAMLGYDHLLAPGVGGRDPTREPHAVNGGLGVAADVAYRMPHPIAPFLELSYWQLYRNDLGSLSAVAASGGFGVDVWRVRARAAMGFYDMLVRADVAGDRLRTSTLDLGYAFSVDAFFARGRRFQVGAHAKLIFISEAETTFVAVGPIIGGDALTW